MRRYSDKCCAEAAVWQKIEYESSGHQHSPDPDPRKTKMHSVSFSSAISDHFNEAAAWYFIGVILPLVAVSVCFGLIACVCMPCSQLRAALSMLLLLATSICCFAWMQRCAETIPPSSVVQLTGCYVAKLWRTHMKTSMCYMWVGFDDSSKMLMTWVAS